MIVSRTLKYVYVGIPRTGSKSMNKWLMEHYEGEWFGDHHGWRVPAFAKDYLIFTIVRNPYDRSMSGYFGIPWGDVEQREAFREQAPLPEKSANPLTKIIKQAIAREVGDPQGEGAMNQAPFVRKAGVSLALYFERMPAALNELPFVAKGAAPGFPHVLERGIRPRGNFFDFFSEDDEVSLWDYAREDFEAFGYKRYSCGLPAEAPNAIHFPSL